MKLTIKIAPQGTSLGMNTVPHYLQVLRKFMKYVTEADFKF